MPDLPPTPDPALPVTPGSAMLRKAPPAWAAAKAAAEIPQQPASDEERLVRSYVVTGGRTRRDAELSDLALESLVVLAPGARAAELQYEKAQIAALCHDVLSVAEIAAHTHLPLGVARVLLADMLAEGYLDVHVPSTNRSGTRPDAALLEKVLDGLRSV